jgi:hypothetical protein
MALRLLIGDLSPIPMRMASIKVIMDPDAEHVNSPYLATTYSPPTQCNTESRLFEHETERMQTIIKSERFCELDGLPPCSMPPALTPSGQDRTVGDCDAANCGLAQENLVCPRMRRTSRRTTSTSIFARVERSRPGKPRCPLGSIGANSGGWSPRRSGKSAMLIYRSQERRNALPALLPNSRGAQRFPSLKRFDKV